MALALPSSAVVKPLYHRLLVCSLGMQGQFNGARLDVAHLINENLREALGFSPFRYEHGYYGQVSRDPTGTAPFTLYMPDIPMHIAARTVRQGWLTFKKDVGEFEKGLNSILVLLHDAPEKPIARVKVRAYGSARKHPGVMSIMGTKHVKDPRRVGIGVALPPGIPKHLRQAQMEMSNFKPEDYRMFKDDTTPAVAKILWRWSHTKLL